MSKKHQARPDGLAYSTNKDLFNDYPEDEPEDTLPANQQRLKVKLDTKQRAGKVVTLVEGFVGTTEDLNALGKFLKTKCGSGGSVKDGLILVQGDYRQRVVQLLIEEGYSRAK